jgi:hypothetical protein
VGAWILGAALAAGAQPAGKKAGTSWAGNDYERLLCGGQNGEEGREGGRAENGRFCHLGSCAADALLCEIL